MARQTSLHHRSNQTRNRHGWRWPAERKLRLGVRQYGERYLWFESISLHQEVPASCSGFPASRNVRQCKALARQRLVCGGHSSGFAAPCPRMRPRVSVPRNSVSQMTVELAKSRRQRRPLDYLSASIRRRLRCERRRNCGREPGEGWCHAKGRAHPVAAIVKELAGEERILALHQIRARHLADSSLLFSPRRFLASALRASR